MLLLITAFLHSLRQSRGEVELAETCSFDAPDAALLQPGACSTNVEPSSLLQRSILQVAKLPPRQHTSESHGSAVASVNPLSLLEGEVPVVHGVAGNEVTNSTWNSSNFHMSLHLLSRFCEQVSSAMDRLTRVVIENTAQFTPQVDLAYGKEWIILSALVISLMLVDSKVLVKLPDTQRNNVYILVVQLVFWSAYAACFTFRHGAEKGLMWFHGYLMDWMLSIDSLFIFYSTFRRFRTPRCLRKSALTSALCSAAACRVALFFILQPLSTCWDMARPLIAGGLIAFGIRAGFAAESRNVPSKGMLKVLRWILGSRYDSPEAYDVLDNSLTISYQGKHFVTFLFFVVLSMESMDMSLMASVISAKVMQVPDLFIGCSSSVAAIFGLRAFFLISQDYMDYLVDLKYAICAIYIFTGCIVMQQRWVVMDVPFLFLVNAVVFALCMIAFVVCQTRNLHGSEDLWFGVFEGSEFGVSPVAAKFSLGKDLDSVKLGTFATNAMFPELGEIKAVGAKSQKANLYAHGIDCKNPWENSS